MPWIGRLAGAKCFPHSFPKEIVPAGGGGWWDYVGLEDYMGPWHPHPHPWGEAKW